MKIRFPDIRLESAVVKLCQAIATAEGRAFLVGGCVRDSILGLPLKDVDVEVYGVVPERLTTILSSRFRLDLVGQAFGVIKICLLYTSPSPRD